MICQVKGGMVLCGSIARTAMFNIRRKKFIYIRHFHVPYINKGIISWREVRYCIISYVANLHETRQCILRIHTKFRKGGLKTFILDSRDICGASCKLLTSSEYTWCLFSTHFYPSMPISMRLTGFWAPCWLVKVHLQSRLLHQIILVRISFYINWHCDIVMKRRFLVAPNDNLN